MLGALVLGESMNVTVLAGIALVLAGVALTCRRAKRANGETWVGRRNPGAARFGI